MAKPILAQYLSAASALEHRYLLAYDEGFPAARGSWGSIYEDFHQLKLHYRQATKTLGGQDLKAIQKIHASVKFLFPPKAGQTRTYSQDAKPLHYIRIALEHNLGDLVQKYFDKLTPESKSQAFELLCKNFGSRSGNHAKDGERLIANAPLSLLVPVKEEENGPRIIDVLLQDKTPKAVPSEPKNEPIDKINTAKLFGFYRDVFATYNKRTRFDILLLKADELMEQENIRLLFPLEQDLDDPSFIDRFKKDPRCMANLESSFECLLIIYGLELNKTSKAISFAKRTHEAPLAWLLPQNRHWQQNIERVLKCLTALDLTEHARAFLSLLETIAKNEGSKAIDRSTMKAWRKAASS